MGALLRTELLAEVLSRVTGELLIALGWRGTAVLVLATLLAWASRRSPEEAPAAGGPGGVNVACVATVLLALLLLDAH